MAPKKTVIKKSALSPTILIAGGAGFIGSHLAETLLLKDSRVIILDNFRTGKRSYVNHLLSNPKFALYDIDINQGIPEEIESVDYIFHLAGLEEYKGDASLDSLLTNAVGTKHLLDLAHRSNAKFVLASSIYVYHGMMSQVNLEQYFGKTSSEEGKYSMTEAKRYAEALVWEYFRKNGTDVRIVRLPEVYGPKMDLDSSGDLGRMMQELKDNRDLNVYGDGVEKEYYLYINDAVSGLIKSLFNEKTKGKIYSLVGSEPFSVLEIAFLLKSLANRELKIEFRPKDRDVDPKNVLPDTTNLWDLDWQAKTSFKEGIVKTLAWLGYEVNTHSFKPAKLIEEKRKEKTGDSLISLADFGKSEESAQTASSVPPVPPAHPAQPTQSQPSTSVQPQTAASVSQNAFLPSKPEKKPAFKLHLPSLSVIPSFLKRKNDQVNFASGHESRTKFMLLVITLIISFTAVLFIVIPSAQAYINLKIASVEIKRVPVLLSQFDAPGAQNAANDAFQHFYKSQKALSRLLWLSKVTGKSDYFNSVSNSLASAMYSSRAAYYLAKAAAPVSTLWETLRPDSEKTFDYEGFEKAKSDFSTALANIQLAQAEFQEVQPDLFSGDIKTSLNEYETTLNTTISNMDLVSAFLMGFSDLIGVDESRKYLILFQNSNEMRPTGGFIGSYAILELKDGKIADLTIDDIYNPDGQIDLREIKVPSPAPIATYLNEPDLHIRNANWHPDFTQSARDIQDLYFKVTGDKTDGVIALDLYFAKELLKVSGPIFLTAYNEEISADNLYERAQYHSEFNYTDGSDQKRSFLTVLGSKLLEKLFAVPKEKLPEFWTSVSKSLDERHLMIYLNNNTFGAYLEKEGWDGSLVKTDEDYLYVVNSNLGGTKANYFVKNEMSYEVFSATRDGLLRAVVTMKYTHTGESDAWPGGPYKDYVRVLTQNGSKLTGAEITYANSEKTDIYKDIAINKISNYNSFEYGFTLNPKESVELKIYYDLPVNLSLTKDKMDYNLYWQKQPGTEGDTFKFKFNPPFSLIADPSSVEGILNTDQTIHVSLDPQ